MDMYLYPKSTCRPAFSRHEMRTFYNLVLDFKTRSRICSNSSTPSIALEMISCDPQILLIFSSQYYDYIPCWKLLFSFRKRART
jgi:hypothetical protein